MGVEVGEAKCHEREQTEAVDASCIGVATYLPERAMSNVTEVAETGARSTEEKTARFVIQD